MELDTRGISCCFDEESKRILKDYRKSGLGSQSSLILSGLKQLGLMGRTTLELGSGIGALTLELLRAGAASSVGLDLSPNMVETARSLATEAGLSGSARFTLGNGATDKLLDSDIVVLDRVVCCYPDYGALIDNTSSYSKRYYAISIPDDRRIVTKILRVFLPLQGVFRRKGSFRFFIHSTERVFGKIQDKGFRVVYESASGRIWSVVIFEASVPSSNPAAA